MNSKLIHLIAGLSISLFVATVQAADNTLDLSLPNSTFSTPDPLFFMLAANEVGIISEKSESTPPPPFKPSKFSGSNIHKFLAIRTMILSALTFATHFHTNGFGERDVNGLHGTLGKATGVLALATVASGFISHWDDFDMEDGWSDPDNLHVVLATTGAVLMAYAIANSATQTTGRVDHSGMAELGALSMLVAIKLTW
ncbi:MAG: hypothetical protein R8K20_11025 [Gallionellaceae bacterium]